MPYGDIQGIHQIVRELFPMMAISCDIIESAIQKRPSYRVSPTARFSVCYKQLNLIQMYLNRV